ISGAAGVMDVFTAVSTFTVASEVTIPPGPAARNSYLVVCLGCAFISPFDVSPTDWSLAFTVVCAASVDSQCTLTGSGHLMSWRSTAIFPFTGATAIFGEAVLASKRAGSLIFAH